MNITKEDIRKALGSGSLKWSDIASPKSSGSKSYGEQDAEQRNSEQQIVTKQIEPEKTPTATPIVQNDSTDYISSEDSIETKTVDKPKSVTTVVQNPQTKKSTPVKKDLGVFDLIGASFKSIAKSAIQNNVDNLDGQNAYMVAPNMNLVDKLNEGAQDPDFYKYLNFVNKQQSKTYYDIPKEWVDRNAIKPEDRWKYDRDQAMIKESIQNPDLTDKISEALKTPLNLLSIYSKNPLKIVGDIEQGLGVVNQSFPTSQSDLNEANRQSRYGQELRRQGKKTLGQSVLGGLNEAAGLTIAPMTLGMIAPDISHMGGRLPVQVGSFAGAGYGAYKSSDAVNENVGFRELNENEIPDNLKEAHIRYGDAVNQWSRADNKIKDEIPSIDEVLSGKNVNSTSKGADWSKNAVGKLSEMYKSNEDWKNTYRGINDAIDAPDPEFSTEYPKLSSTMSSLGASYSTGVSMLANVAATAAIQKLSKHLLSGNGVSPVASYLIQNATGIAASTANAYVSVKSREAEFYSQFLQSWDKRFDANLVKNGMPTLSKIDDSNLLSLVDERSTLNSFKDQKSNKIANGDARDILNSYSIARQELKSTGTLSENTRSSLERGIKSGILKTRDNSKIQKAIASADYGSDELGRDFMSMIYSDMIQNATAALPFNSAAIKIATKNSPGLVGSISRTSEDVANYINSSMYGKATRAIANASIKGVRVGAVPEFGGIFLKRWATEAPQEIFLEENPQQLLQYKYEEGRLSKSKNAIDVLKNTYTAAGSAAQAMVGMGDDSRYRDGINENAYMTALTMLGHGAVGNIPGIVKEISETQKSEKAKNFVQGVIVNQMRTADRVNKTNSYVNAITKGKEDLIIQHLEELSKNPPEGIDAEDIKEEISTAKRTMSIANNKTILGYANRAGGVGSENHKLLVALAIDHSNASREESQAAITHTVDYMNKRRESFKTSPMASYFNEHNESNPDNQISPSQQENIFDAVSKVTALNNINFNSNIDSDNSKRKMSILNDELIKNMELASNKLNDLLEESNLIDKKEDGIHKNIATDNIENLGLPEIDNELIQSIGMASLSNLGAKYESEMSNRLLNYNGKKGKSLDKNIYDIHVDKLLDEYRSSRQSEENTEKTKELIDEVKEEGLTTSEDKPEYQSNSDIISTSIEEIKPEDTLTPEMPPVSPYDESQTPKEGSETIESTPIETPVEELKTPVSIDTPTPIKDEVGTTTTTDISSVDKSTINEFSEVDRLINQLNEGSIVADEKPDLPNTSKEAVDNKEVLEAIEDTSEFNSILDNEDTGAFNQLIEEMPGLASSNSIKHDRISHTVFANVNAPVIREFLMDPIAFKSADIKIIVNKHGTGNTYSFKSGGMSVTGNDFVGPNDFNASNPLTWDNAYIKVEIKYKKGTEERTIAFNMKNPGEREQVTTKSGMLKYSTDEIQALRDFRNSIISEHLKVIADPSLQLRMLSGFERGISKLSLNRTADDKAIQRGLHEVVGLLDEPDVNKLGLANLTLAYGRGSKGSNLVVSLFETIGTTINENAGSIFVTKTEPFDANSERKIKVNKKKVGTDPEMADLIYKLAIDMYGSNARQVTLSPSSQVIETNTTSPYGLTPASLLYRMVGFGESTKQNEESSKSFLENKQFYVEDGILHYGSKIVAVNSISEKEKGDVLSFINDNLTWTINKDDLWDRENNTDNLVSDIFPGIKSFFDRNPDESSVGFTKQFSINREDLGITWTAWLIKNKKLTSDIADGVFEPPYLFMTNVTAVSNGAEKISPINNGAYNTSVTPEDKPIMDPTEFNKETTPEIIDTASAKQLEIDAAKEAYENRLKSGSRPRGAEIMYENTLSEIERKYARTKKPELPNDIVLPVIVTTPSAKSLDEFDDFGATRMIDDTTPVVDFINVEKSINFIKSKLGDNFDVKVLEDAISLHNGGSAMGMTSGNRIDLYKLAEKGTEFHEVYHRASLLLIPRSRRMAIYDQVRTTNDAFKYATDIEVEEYLAEKFRERLLSNDVDPANGTMINIAFRKISNAFNALSNFKDRDIYRLYRDIETGVLKGITPSYYNAESFSIRYDDGFGAPRRFKDAGLQSIKTVEAKDKLVNSLTYYLFEISGIQTIDDISKLDYQGLKSSLFSSAEKIKDNPDEIARYSLYKEAYDRFDDYFLPAIKAEVKNTGITEFTPKDKDVEDGIVGREIQEHDKASYEISKRDNIRAEVKFFIRTIPETEIKNNTAVVKRDEISKFPSFVEFELAWNTMIYELHKEINPEAMKKRIEVLAHEKKNPFFIMLENRLSKMDDNFITKFWNTMYSHRHDYVNTVYNSNSAKPDSEYNRSIRNLSSNIDRATRVLPILWGQNMMSGGYLYTVTDDGLVFNKENAESIISRYKDLIKSITKASSIEDANKALESFTGLLNDMSIDVDMDTMEWILGNNFPGFTRQRAISILMNDYKDTAKVFTTILPQIIKDNGGKNRVKINELTPKVLLGGEKSINNYAKIYAQTHPNPQEVMVPGADGSNLYQISSRNFVTDVIDKISNNPEYLKSMLSVPINQGSILLNQIKNGTSRGISFGTFVKIYEEGIADQGRDYFDISPMEDYVIKMSNLLDSNITLPAMADKKTYGFIFGIKLPNMVSSDKGTQKMSWTGNSISYPSEVIDIFNGYYTSEFNAIKQAWSKYKEESGNQKLLINNYHYDNSGKWAAGHGNGLRFRYFDSLYINSKTVGDEYNGFVNLNDYIDKVITTRGPIIGNDSAMDEALQRIDKKFFSESYENKTKMISSTITAATKFEMDYAEEIGLISRTTSEYAATIAREGVNIGDIVKSTMYENKALDAALYNSNVSDYIKAGVAPKDANMVAITNILANTTINSIISEFETDKLISKDLAFYKSSDDKTKRLSSVLSTGTALRNSFPEGHVLNGITSFNVAEISDSIIKSTEIDEVKNKSYAAQINRLLSQVGKPRIPNLSELYSNPEMKSELDALKSANKAVFDMGEKIIDNQSKAYEKVNVTDATVYISPYMYRSIMTRLGEDYFTPTVEEAFKLLESDDLSWMDDADAYEKVSQLALHPLKMVYFGDSFESGLNVPKLDKMAMFLLPKFMATGDLRNLYERMNNPKVGQQKVDMAPFSSAVKTYNDNPVAIHTGADGSVMSPLNDIKVAQQSFEFLRHQLPTTPHEGATMAVATQVQKASMGNIIPDGIYPNITINGKNDVTGTQLKQEWVSALNELSDRGKTDIEKEFGLKLGEDGNYEFNTKKMYDFLTIESENSGMPSDVTEMLASFDPANPKDMPLQALVDGAFVESKILSHILKSTVDVNTPGGMFIQMTPFGLKSFDNTNTQYKINGGKKLKFLNPDGSMDVVISITMFKDILPSDLNTHNAKIQWLLDNNIIGENAAPCAIGYRIPTQGLSSIISAKFVDALPEFLGDTVIMPDEFTALTGSDFDVDKIYISRYNFVKSGDKFIKAQMDDSKENKFQTNSSKAIQNRFIDVMLAVVSNPESINETRIPLDAVTDPVKSALKEIDKYNKDSSVDVPFSKSRLSYESRKKMEYAGGKGGIPTFALAGVHHVLTQIAGLKFRINDVVSKFGLEDIAKINGNDGLRVLDWLSAMVNAHVDVAKDPYIIRMGVNQGTYKMTALLLRAGYGEKTFFFLSQPSLKDIYKILARKGSEYLTGNRNSDKSSIDREVNNMITFYKKKAKETAKSSFDQKKLENLYEENDKGFVKIHNENAFDKNTLINNMARTNVTGFDHYYGQLVVLETYKELSKYASALSELVKYSQVDTKKAGNAFSAQRLFADKVNEIMMDPKSLFANVGDFFNNTFIYNKLNNSAGLSKNLSQGVFFRSTKSVEMSTDRILDAMGRRNLDNRDIITKISKYVDTKLKSDFFDKLAKEREVSGPKMFFGENTMAKRLFSIQQRFPEDVKSNYFLRGMSAEIYSRLESERPDQIRPRDNNTNEPGLTEKLKQHYSSALDSDNAEIAQFAKDFLLYQFYSTGDNHASNTVKISEYDRKDTGYYKFIADKLDELSSNTNEALSVPDLIDIFENRWYDEDLVPTIQHFNYTPDGKLFMPKIDSTKKINGIQYPLAFFNTGAYPLSGLGNVEENRPFVKIQMFPKEEQPFYVLYRLYGTSSTEDQPFPTPMYVAVDKKGSKKNAISMIEHNVQHSMVKNNILPESFSSKNRIGAQEYGEAASMAGQYNELYANVKPSNILTFDLKNKEIISNIESVVEPTIIDTVNEPNKVEATTFTVEDISSDGIDKQQIETINEGFKRAGLEEMTEEQFNSMDKDLLESLKACFGA